MTAGRISSCQEGRPRVSSSRPMRRTRRRVSPRANRGSHEQVFKRPSRSPWRRLCDRGGLCPDPGGLSLAQDECAGRGQAGCEGRRHGPRRASRPVQILVPRRALRLHFRLRGAARAAALPGTGRNARPDLQGIAAAARQRGRAGLPVRGPRPLRALHAGALPRPTAAPGLLRGPACAPSAAPRTCSSTPFGANASSRTCATS